MRARSLKLQRAMRVYRGMIDAFLADHPTCEFPLGCVRPAVVAHHRRGRFGRRLLDQQWWAASCNFHNQYAEDHSGESLACGWLVRIEGTGDAA